MTKVMHKESSLLKVTSLYLKSEHVNFTLYTEFITMYFLKCMPSYPICCFFWGGLRFSPNFFPSEIHFQLLSYPTASKTMFNIQSVRWISQILQNLWVQWFTNFTIHQNGLEDLIKYKLLSAIPQISDSVCLQRRGFTILKSSQEMLTSPVWRPHLENHCLCICC